MKEYTLVKKDQGLSDMHSETYSIEKAPHQRECHSINEISEFEDETKQDNKLQAKQKIHRRKRTRADLDDTDSEFELPSYTTKNKMVDSQRLSRRQRKASFKVKDFISDDSGIDIHEDYKSESIQQKSEEFQNEYPNLNQLNLPSSKKQFRKYSNESTLDGSNYFKNNGVQQKNGYSAFRKILAPENKMKSNFEHLIKA